MDPASVPVLILAGGLGTRLRGLVTDRPKPLAEVAGRPFLAWTLDRLETAGFRCAVLCTGHLAHRARELLGERHGRLELDYSEEAEPLGTGGALRLAARRTEGPTLMALNGDSYLGLEYGAFLAFHAAHQGDASLALLRVPDAGRYGQVELDGEGRIAAFREKGEGPGPGLVNGGVYLLPRPRMEALPGGPLSVERDVFPAWAGQAWGYPVEAPFLDIGLPETLAAAEAFMGRIEKGKKMPMHPRSP